MQRVILPHMGGIEEGTLLRWHRQKGNRVLKGETLAEVETEKIIIEVESLCDGIMRELLVQEGETISAGAVLAFIGTETEHLPDLNSPLRLPEKFVQPSKRTDNLPVPTRLQKGLSLILIVVLLIAFIICIFKDLWFLSIIAGILFVSQLFLTARLFRVILY